MKLNIASQTTTEGKELDSLHTTPPCERLHGRTTSFDHRACGRATPTETDFSIVVQFRTSEDPNRRCDSPDSTESNDAPQTVDQSCHPKLKVSNFPKRITAIGVFGELVRSLLQALQ
jgi:hypothetical protein